MLDFVKSATCLVLDKRIEQAYKLRCQFESLFPDKKLNIFLAGDGYSIPYKYDIVDTNELPPMYTNTTPYSTWRNKPGAYNAWKCHYRIITDFLRTGEKYLWLLEDDCIFTDDTKEILENVDKALKNEYFSGLYLGYYSNGHTSKHTDNNIKWAFGVAGFHSVILHREVLKRLLHDIDYLPIAPFDEMTQKYHKHPSYSPFYCIYPQVCLQRSGYSYVEQSNLEKPDRYKI